VTSKHQSNDEPLSWTLPGFRTQKIWKTIIALCGYSFMIYILMSAIREYRDEQTMMFIVCFGIAMDLWHLELIAYVCNYRRIRQRGLFHNSANRSVRFLIMS